MEIIVKIIKLFWNIIITLLVCIIKVVSFLLYFPLKFFKFIFSIAGGLLTFLGWGAAIVMGIIYIVSWKLDFFSDKESYPIQFHIMYILLALFCAAIPFWVNLYGIIIFENIVEKNEYFLLSVPATIFVLSFSDGIIFKYNIFEKKGNKEKSKRSEENSYEGNNQENTSTNDEKAQKQKLSNFFVGITTFDETKKRYRDLLKIYHPDNQAGDTETTQIIQDEYADMLKINGWK